MTCVMCDNQKILKATIAKTHKFKECGLDNVILHGITTYHCNKCGEEYFSYGNIVQLHELIATSLIRKSSVLSGKEIRFLRKHLGFSAVIFAKLVGYESEHLSRIENGKVSVQEVFDRLVRMLVLNKLPDRQYDLQDLILNEKPIKQDRLEYSLINDCWKSAA